MTNTSSTPPVKNVSVGVATHICKITVHVTLQHTGSAGDFVTIHDRFLVALEGNSSRYLFPYRAKLTKYSD